MVDRTYRRDSSARLIRTLLLVILDICLVNVSSVLALGVRVGFDFSLPQYHNWTEFSIVYTVVAIAVFVPLRFYSSLWEYASVDEFLHIVGAALILMILQYVMLSTDVMNLPMSFPLLNAMILTLLVTLSRLSYRLARRYYGKLRHRTPKRRTMVIGAGSAGLMAIREFQTSSHSNNQVVCIIDDDRNKLGRFLCNVRIVGTRHEIVAAAEKYRVEEIVLAIPSATPAMRREIIQLCQETKLRIKTLPGLYQLANGEVSIKKIRDINVLDLLGRDSIHVDMTEVAAYLSGRVILVTGGGGSIGSELCRQIATYNPKELIVLDIYENNAYQIQQELLHTHPELKLTVRIASIRDLERMDMLFDELRPDVVFHAAAHKHVPLMEDSPNEAVKNNVFGTLNVARVANKYGVKAFVLISSDKAVNPTNVMGATKRICEMIVQTMAEHSKTKFVAVRFGNVLGSNGSVIPLFQQQIAEGGPVTVTNKNIIRYFMSIPEATSLVLQAGYYAQRGEIFVLDMGEPVKIDDLARNMIRMSGLEPDVDIPIVYTGLRPGEKMYEEMLMQEEGLRSTPNHLIYIGKPLEIDEEAFAADLERLELACKHNSAQIRDIISDIVPTYRRLTDTRT